MLEDLKYVLIPNFPTSLEMTYFLPLTFSYKVNPFWYLVL